MTESTAPEPQASVPRAPVADKPGPLCNQNDVPKDKAKDKKDSKVYSSI